MFLSEGYKRKCRKVPLSRRPVPAKVPAFAVLCEVHPDKSSVRRQKPSTHLAPASGINQFHQGQPLSGIQPPFEVGVAHRPLLVRPGKPVGVSVASTRNHVLAEVTFKVESHLRRGCPVGAIGTALAVGSC